MMLVFDHQDKLMSCGAKGFAPACLFAEFSPRSGVPAAVIHERCVCVGVGGWVGVLFQPDQPCSSWFPMCVHFSRVAKQHFFGTHSEVKYCLG